MEVKKVLFISQEIAPYVPENEMSVMSRRMPQGIQERGAEVRTFMPKYGTIAERSNQLHEVIRLSGMNVIIDDTDHPLIIKVATLQSARIQVYFIYNEDYFANSRIQELETEATPDDNDERSIFFVRGVIETVRKLRWIPDVVQCNGWMAALAPLYLRTSYGDDPVFRDAKVVTALYDEKMPAPLNARLSDKLRADGITKTVLKPIAGKELDYQGLMSLAMKYSDGIIQCTAQPDAAVLEEAQASGLPLLPYSDADDRMQQIYDFYASL